MDVVGLPARWHSHNGSRSSWTRPRLGGKRATGSPIRFPSGACYCELSRHVLVPSFAGGGFFLITLGGTAVLVVEFAVACASAFYAPFGTFVALFSALCNIVIVHRTSSTVTQRRPSSCRFRVQLGICFAATSSHLSRNWSSCPPNRCCAPDTSHGQVLSVSLFSSICCAPASSHKNPVYIQFVIFPILGRTQSHS